MIQVYGAYQCGECKKEHLERVECECGACLHKNGEQIIEPDEEDEGPMYPIFKCKRCNARHFWD